MLSHCWRLRLAGLTALALTAGHARAGLEEYVKKPEPKFAWKLLRTTATPTGKVYNLHLVSQTWQGITWEHDLVVYVPKGVKPGRTLFLFNTGGRPSVVSTALMMELGGKMGLPCAFLYGIPNQPLLGGKKEDALIAETFVRYLRTKDESWPLLFPMVKSLVKAMDALQEFSKKEWDSPLRQFVVSGGSKRGWTSWLTAAADRRVKAIAPLVIDTLNMQKQLPHQLKSYGAYSAMIKDYTERKLVPMVATPGGRRLWQMVDPWVYRDRLALPKLLVNGTNDPYWTQDALNLYWGDLKGDKWVLYVPNAGHNLVQVLEGGRKDMTRVRNTLAAFARHQATGKPMPRLSWRHAGEGEKFRLSVRCDPAPKGARLWVADSPTRDFRKSKWSEKPARVKGGEVSGEVSAPESGFRVFFAECEYEEGGLSYFLSTQLRIVGKAKEGGATP